ncbi:MAG: nucleotide pyrophosphohydrolase [Bacteroidetes bacterium]|nr:nucleotide pyrophosphohydrolase [Bacteroidota bacterium]
MTINSAQKQVDEWIQSSGVRYFNELTNLGILQEETGELARLMVRIYGEQSFKENEKPTDHSAGKKMLADEMADVLWVLICLANQTGIQLEEAFKNNMQKKINRDSKRHLQNEKLKKL